MLNNNIHKGILVQILKDIYSNTKISPFLGFKGGTAVYLFYKLDRFSVDLDFDLLEGAEKEDVFEEIKQIVSKYGEVKDARIMRYSIFLMLSYAKGSMNIKVEINLRDFGSEFEMKSYLGIPMRVMTQEDIFAHKLVAMHERLGKANRDIYDVHFFLKHHWAINESIVEQRVDMSFTDFIAVATQQLSKLSSRNILSGIGELVSGEQKAWVKNNLIQDTVFLMRSRWSIETL